MNLQTNKLGYLEDKYLRTHEDMRRTYAQNITNEKQQKVNLENKLVDLKNKALYRD